MRVTKSLKIPIHYAVTEAKLDKLNKLTARITYGIRLTSSFISEDTELDRKTVRKIVKDHDIAGHTGLSAAFVDQIVDKVIWSWRSYYRLHNDWQRRVEGARRRIELTDDEAQKSKAEASLSNLINLPTIPKDIL